MLSNPAFFSWLLAASLSLAILWAAFVCFFRNWTFFALNRWILVAGTCVCMALPLVSPHVTQGLVAPDNLATNLRFSISSLPISSAPAGGSVANEAHATQSYEWLWTFLAVMYWAGFAAVLARSFKALWQLKTIRSQSRLLSSNSIADVWVQSLLPTFSFGKNIFLNVHTLSLAPEQFASVQRHEEGHALQKHSVDNVFFEVVSAIFWFNPLVRKLSRHLRDVHEFLADRWATGPHAQTADYQELLVALASKTPCNRVSHPFSDSQFFRRIVMLNKPKTKPMERLKLFLLAPACAAALFVSACVDTDKKAPANPQSIGPASGPVISKISWTGNKVHSDEELSALLTLKPGDKYDRRAFESSLYREPLEKSVTSLYMDNGYLFFHTDIQEKVVDGKIELTVNVSEDEQVWVNKVTLKAKNGEKSLTDQVKPFVEVKEGQLFNRSLLISSQEKMAKSGLVNPDSVNINPYPRPVEFAGAKRYVDIEFVVQKPL
ncbi:Surface antigen variable number repeat-containing protein [Dyadobacter soli]|uniref:Surface antigen variable number repeat-containing protein n=1 Tax=Dyadobacter soli TaxID=659014 RepID=A0A1G7GFQ7_9BACT|nr:M56 family metallopeptidase [Dyadobacter soli]SDE86964.1 Surface antigen variable number repeat-containing protein [Dyadobacter soli]